MTTTDADEASADADTGRAGGPVAMFTLLQTMLLVVAAVVVTVGVTLLLTDDGDGGSGGSFNDVDIGFLADMTTHHQGAITLGFEYLPNQNDQTIAHTAREVILNQSQEIAMMNNLLGQAGDAADAIQNDEVAMEWMGHPVDPAAMPGMATREELEELAAATGLGADDLFSRLMILHHAAGVEMAEYEARHGENETVRNFARKIAEIQRTEIGELNERRVALGLPPVEIDEPLIATGAGR